VASSHGTRPHHTALGLICRAELLRRLLESARDILHFQAQRNAGLAYSVWVLGLELAFWMSSAWP
jgi:hypothetical protein